MASGDRVTTTDRELTDRQSAEDEENAREAVIDRTGTTPDLRDTEPAEPALRDEAPPATDVSTVAGRDVLPTEETDSDPAEAVDGPQGGPDHGAVPDDLFTGPQTDRDVALEQADDPAILDEMGGLDAAVDRVDQTDHNTDLLDSLAPDDLGDVVPGEQAAPADQDLSGNETGDGATMRSPFPGMVYKDGEGFVPEEKVDPGLDDEVQDLIGDTFGWNPFGSGDDGETTTLGDERMEAAAIGAIDDADDYDPESGGPVYKSPSMDPEVGDTYFGIGQDAAAGSEVQYADTPESGEGDALEYDGIDYGQEYSDPDLDRHEAEAMAALDPLSSPDVDPIEHTSGGDLFVTTDAFASTDSGPDDTESDPPDESVGDLSM
ncbi:MAG: hypothetical protein ACR2QO_11645 [Acidimicrobiales bacterium]